MKKDSEDSEEVHGVGEGSRGKGLEWGWGSSGAEGAERRPGVRSHRALLSIVRTLTFLAMRWEPRGGGVWAEEGLDVAGSLD